MDAISLLVSCLKCAWMQRYSRYFTPRTVLGAMEVHRVRWAELPTDTPMIAEYVTKLSATLHKMTGIAIDHTAARQRVNNDRRMKSARGIELTPGDYVFAAMPCNTYGRKLIFIWQGPYEVKEMKNPKVAILKNV